MIYLVNALLWRNFCWKNLRVNFRNFHSTLWQWKNEKFSLTKKIFRQINSLVISLVNTFNSRNFYQKCVRLNLSNFHTVTVKFTKKKIPKNSREINSLAKNTTFTKFSSKKCAIYTYGKYFVNATFGETVRRV